MFYIKRNPLAKLSDSGWTYCLESSCGQYIKIGKTTDISLDRYLRRRRCPDYALNMTVSWAYDDAALERLFHVVLSDYRCIYRRLKRASADNRGALTDLMDTRKLSNYATREERDQAPKWKRYIDHTSLELFKISSDEALFRLRRCV